MLLRQGLIFIMCFVQCLLQYRIELLLIVATWTLNTRSSTYFFAMILSVFGEKSGTNNFLQKLWKEKKITGRSYPLMASKINIYLFLNMVQVKAGSACTIVSCHTRLNGNYSGKLHLVIKNSSVTGKTLPKAARNLMQYVISCTSSSNH